MEKIVYGFYKSAIGEMVLGKTEKGLCWLGFMVEGYKGNGQERMFGHFKKSVFIHDDKAVQELGREVMDAWKQGREGTIRLDLHGTPFQKTVWKSLMKIGKGKRCAYDDVANDIGKPKAARAVGGAVGSNPVSLIVPCHRVVQKSGALGNYGWGVPLKEKILAAEA